MDKEEEKAFNFFKRVAIFKALRNFEANKMDFDKS